MFDNFSNKDDLGLHNYSYPAHSSDSRDNILLTLSTGLEESSLMWVSNRSMSLLGVLKSMYLKIIK